MKTMQWTATGLILGACAMGCTTGVDDVRRAEMKVEEERQEAATEIADAQAEARGELHEARKMSIDELQEAEQEGSREVNQAVRDAQDDVEDAEKTLARKRSEAAKDNQQKLTDARNTLADEQTELKKLEADLEATRVNGSEDAIKAANDAVIDQRNVVDKAAEEVTRLEKIQVEIQTPQTPNATELPQE